MSVGILIFVISVIISIITTMRENSHKDRQNQKPPQKTSTDNEPKKGGFFEEIERTFKEISEELNEEEKKSSKRKYDDTLPPLFDELPKEEPKSKPVVDCTTEACDFRDNLEMFNDLDVAVYGISGDSKKKHQNFIEKHGLNFDLLVDEDFKLAKETGVYQLKKSFGKESMGIVRTTFIIDEQGKVLDVIEKVKVKTQIEELKNILG